MSLRQLLIETARWSRVAERNGDLHARIASALALDDEHSEKAANSSAQKLARLRAVSEDYRLLVFQASSLRSRRDGLALELIDEGLTWREVADAAGFENPYIAELRKKRAGSAPDTDKETK